jgi:hypothetical protein
MPIDCHIKDMKKNPDNSSMRLQNGNYYTVQEMSSILGIPTNTIKKRIFRYGIKAVSKDALYSHADFETIKNAPSPGKPKKPPVETKASKGKPLKQPVKVKKQQS